MSDKIAQYILGLGGDDTDLRNIFTSFKSRVRSDVAELESITSKIDLFPNLEKKVGDAAAALARAKQDVITFTGALAAAKDAGKDVTTDLEKRLAAAQQAVRLTTNEFNRQVDAITRTENALTKAGVDTAALTAEQKRLAVALAEATAAAKLNEAQQVIGLKTLSSIQPEIASVNAALATLTASGKLSGTELAAAQVLARQKVAELRAEVSTAGVAMKDVGEVGSHAFDLIGGKTILAVAGIAGVAEAIKTVIEASNEFAQGVGRIGSVSSATDAQLATLGSRARDLARTLGLDVNEALKALYDLIRSTNIGPDDAITVLDVAARAAKASFSDLNTVTKVSGDLISAFGLQTKDVGGALDALFASSKAGGPSFTDLNGKIGSLSVVAKAAGLNVGQMSALLNVMSSASGDGAGAVSELQKIILKFDTEPVRTQLRAMGITSTDLTVVLTELAKRGTDLNVLLDLGAATTKSAVGVTALTRSASDLSDALKRAGESSGAVEAGLDKIEHLPKEGIEKLSAAFHDLLISLPTEENTVTAVARLTRIINAVVEFQKKQNGFTLDLAAQEDRFNGAADAAELLGQRIAATRVEVENFRKSEVAGFGKVINEDAKAAAEALADLTAKIAKARTELGGIGDSLLSDVKGLNDAAAQQIATIGKAADEQIAALDRSAAAATKTAQATVDIQTKASADILKIITDNAKNVASVTDDAIAAREAALRKTALSEKEIQGDLAKIRLASLQPTIDQYQKFYDTLIAQSQAYAAKIESIDKGRLAFQQSIEQKIFDIRLGAVDAQGKALLTSYDQQVAIANRAEQLISLARAAADKGDLELAQKYADQAIAISGKITTVEETEGKAAISLQVVQTTQLRILKEAQDAVGTAFDNQAKAAKDGLAKTNEALLTVKGQLDTVLKVQQDMRKLADDGLQYKVDVDEDSYRNTKARLDDLARDRIAKIVVQTVDANGNILQSVPVPAQGINAGGYVSKAIRGFATGGPVFRSPSWSKVPGNGDGDTVPALLREGSFVMRKAASQYYGDGIMGRLVRGFADGGPINTDATHLRLTNPNLIADPGLRERLRQQLQEALDQLVKMKSQALPILNPLIDGARTLPRSQFGQNYGEALEAIRDFISSATNPAQVAALVSPIAQFASQIQAAIDNAHRFHVPLVFGISAPGEKGGEFDQSAPSSTYSLRGKDGRRINLSAFLGSVSRLGGGGGGGSGNEWWLGPPGGFDFPNPGTPGGFFQPPHFAAGGAVDSVRALLTPGEYVLNPSAARMLGGGFLHALNQMRVPRGAMDGMLNLSPPRPPLHFANGGPVPGPGALSSAGFPGASSVGLGGDIHLHFEGVDISNPNEIRRVVVPVIRDIMRRAGQTVP